MKKVIVIHQKQIGYMNTKLEGVCFIILPNLLLLDENLSSDY